MSIRRFSATSISSTGSKSSKLWDQETTLGTYESIAAAVVDASNQSEVTFSNIPQNYTHLQLRVSARSTRDFTGNAVDSLQLRVNNTYTVKTHHLLFGDSLSSGGDSAIPFFPDDGGGIANNYGAAIIDILDYTSVTKNKTYRAFVGFDNNSASLPGFVSLTSGLYTVTAAITSLTLNAVYGGVIKDKSQFALYGIRG